MDSVKTPDAEDAKARKIKRILPLIVGVSLFMDQLDATIVNTAIPAMSVSLGVTPLIWQVSGCCRTCVLLIPFGGVVPVTQSTVK